MSHPAQLGARLQYVEIFLTIYVLIREAGDILVTKYHKKGKIHQRREEAKYNISTFQLAMSQDQ